MMCPHLRYNKQHGGVRFGTFTFGPEMMRLFYWLNQPDAAKKVWSDGRWDMYEYMTVKMVVVLCNAIDDGE